MDTPSVASGCTGIFTTSTPGTLALQFSASHQHREGYAQGICDANESRELKVLSALFDVPQLGPVHAQLACQFYLSDTTLSTRTHDCATQGRLWAAVGIGVQW